MSPESALALCRLPSCQTWLIGGETGPRQGPDNNLRQRYTRCRLSYVIGAECFRTRKRESPLSILSPGHAELILHIYARTML